MDGVALLTIFVLSVFVGYEVVAKVSTILHTPLMSGANAIHGIVLLGGIIVLGSAEGILEIALATLAVLLGAINPCRRLRRDRPHARDVQAPQVRHQ